jgi:hypothetical protein
MVMNYSEIQDLKAYLIGLYSGTRSEQEIDDTFYKDTFDVPQIHSIQRLQRTGRGARLIDRPAEHIITSRPQAYRESKDNDVSRKASLSVSKECNRWLTLLKRQNPNAFKEFVKNLLLRGEGWIHPVHNDKWVTGRLPDLRAGMPVLFLTPDPMIIYADPNEDETGVPERVMVIYPKKPSIIKAVYPLWEPKDDKSVTVEWLEYWDKDQIVYMADGKIVYDKPNIYGFVPFVHKLSGFGKSSPDGDMENLIQGRLRKVRDILTRECAIVSDIDSVFHLFANRSIDVQPADGQTQIPPNFSRDYEFGPGMIHEIPYGLSITRSEEMMPEPEAFQYLYRITQELEQEDPLVMSGTAIGATGRQQDMTYTSAMKRYETIIENTEYAFSTALGMGLKLCSKIPRLCPEEYGLKKSDIGENFEIQVILKAENELEAERLSTLGSRLYQQQEIDWRTNLIQYQQKTESEAEDIITNWYVDQVMKTPEIIQLMGLKASEKLGIMDEIQSLRQRNLLDKYQTQAIQQAPPSEMTQRMGETKTANGREMIDMALQNRGQRQPPVAYTRNQ